MSNTKQNILNLFIILLIALTSLVLSPKSQARTSGVFLPQMPHHFASVNKNEVQVLKYPIGQSVLGIINVKAILQNFSKPVELKKSKTAVALAKQIAAKNGANAIYFTIKTGNDGVENVLMLSAKAYRLKG